MGPSCFATEEHYIHSIKDKWELMWGQGCEWPGVEMEEGDEPILGEDGTCVPLGTLSGSIWLACRLQLGC